MSDDLLKTEADGILLLTLNRTDRSNALTRELATEIHESIDAARKAGVKAIVLAANGRSFCAGIDTEDSLAGTSDGINFVRTFWSTQLALATYPGAVVAAVQGPAVGSGAELALAADIVLASSSAWFSFPEAQFGGAPGLAMRYLSRAIGAARARRLVLTGERLNADTAEAWGLVESVLSSEDIVIRARERAAVIARCDPKMLSWMKRQFKGFFVDERGDPQPDDEVIRFLGEQFVATGGKLTPQAASSG